MSMPPPGYHTLAPGLLCPQWSLPPGVRAVVSTREGGSSAPPEFLSTHPSPATRSAELQRSAEKVMPLYEAARR